MRRTCILSTGAIWIAFAGLALATPDRTVTVEERLLGSNATGYVTLRTEVDNLGSYYGSRTRRFLVEYSKEPADSRYEEALGAQIGEKLLLDVKTTHDANTDDPFTAEATTREVNEKDGNVKLADVLERFPGQARTWSADNVARIKTHHTAGPRLGTTSIAWGGWIKQRFVGDQNAELEWKLTEVFEDENCLYLSVTSELHGQRLVSIPPRKTTQVRDQMVKQPIYLIAGHSKDKEEAIKMAREFIKKTNGRFRPEVWSSGRLPEDMIYVVAASDSSQHLGRFQFEELEKLIGAELSVMSSADFKERTPVKLEEGKEGKK